MGGNHDEIRSLADQIRSKGVTRAYTDWIAHQFTLPFEIQAGYYNQMVEAGYVGSQERRSQIFTWWDRALFSPDQLRKRGSAVDYFWG